MSLKAESGMHQKKKATSLVQQNVALVFWRTRTSSRSVVESKQGLFCFSVQAIGFGSGGAVNTSFMRIVLDFITRSRWIGTVSLSVSLCLCLAVSCVEFFFF